MGKPHVVNLEELKILFVTYLKEEKPKLLERKVEAFLKEGSHTIL